MDAYTSEKEQIEQIKKWWKENGLQIIAGLVIGLAVVGGWRGWQYYRQQRNEAASNIYSQLQDAQSVGDSKKLDEYGGQLIDKYFDTPYAALAAVAIAGDDVDNGKLDDAAERLQWTIDHGKDDQLATIARLRLARVDISAGKPKEALAVLAEDQKPGAFEPLFQEVRGDAYLAEKDTGKARDAYQLALAGLKPEMPDRRIVQMKLDDLAKAETPAASTKATSDDNKAGS